MFLVLYLTTPFWVFSHFPFTTSCEAKLHQLSKPPLLSPTDSQPAPSFFVMSRVSCQTPPPPPPPPPSPSRTCFLQYPSLVFLRSGTFSLTLIQIQQFNSPYLSIVFALLSLLFVSLDSVWCSPESFEYVTRDWLSSWEQKIQRFL